MTIGKVKYAPQEVINELDLWNKSPDSIIDLLEDIECEMYDFTSNTSNYVYSPENTYPEICKRELAIVNHVFGDERLQKREPRWYVVSDDKDGECVVYFKTDLNIIDFIHYGDVITYKRGMSKQLADAIVAEVGGEKVEVK